MNYMKFIMIFIKFININKEYIENKDGEIDILKYEEDSDSD